MVVSLVTAYRTLCCALHYIVHSYPACALKAQHFITRASSVDRDVNGGPVGQT